MVTALLIGVIDAVVTSAYIVFDSLEMGLAPELRDVLPALVVVPGLALVLGTIGSFMGLAITYRLRRLRGRGGPAAPTGAS